MHDELSQNGIVKEGWIGGYAMCEIENARWESVGIMVRATMKTRGDTPHIYRIAFGRKESVGYTFFSRVLTLSLLVEGRADLRG